MPRFHYVAVSAQGERIEGVGEAETATSLADRLRATGHFVIRVGAASLTARLKALLDSEVTLAPAFSRGELALLLDEWATLVDAGVPLAAALKLSAGGRRGKKARIVDDIRRAVTTGEALNVALGRYPAVFPATVQVVVRAGELSGDLAGVLARLAADMEAEERFSGKLRGALIYPAFLTVTATAAITVLLVYVVPTLETVVAADGRPLPASAAVVTAASRFLREWGATVAALAAAGLGLLVAGTRWGPWRRRLDAALLRLPLVGPVIREVEASRVLYTLAALTGGGVALDRALALAGPSARNHAVRARITAAEKAVVAGRRLDAALGEARIMPEDAMVLISVGEATGALDRALRRAATLVSERIRRRMERFVTLLSPILTLFFGMLAAVIIGIMLTTILSINELAF